MLSDRVPETTALARRSTVTVTTLSNVFTGAGVPLFGDAQSGARPPGAGAGARRW